MNFIVGVEINIINKLEKSEVEVCEVDSLFEEKDDLLNYRR